MSKPTKVPGISKPPASLAPDVKRYLETLAEAVEIRLGRRGDKRDRAITLRELIDSGLAVDLKSTPFDPNNLNGGNLGFAPNDILDTNVPPAPLNFQAAGAYSQVNLSWDFPRYSNHAFTEIYGHDSDVIGDAQLIAVSAGRGTSDPVGSGVSRYYWARFVSTSGIVGPWNNSSGTLATTAPDVEHLLGVLNGAITSSELATSLSTPIGNLPANTALEISNEAAARVAGLAAEADARVAAITTESGQRAADLATEAANRAAAIAASATALQGQIDDLLDIDVYDNATTYALGDQVTYDGKLYKALQASTGNLPTNTTYWSLLGNYTSLGDAVGNNTAAITEINTVSAGSGSATARALHGLQVTVNDGATGLVATRASLLNDYYTSASVDSAIASATSTLVATSTLADYTTTAGLVQNYYTKTAADSAISSATQDLVSTTELATELGNYTTTAGLTQNYYTKTDADSAISSATQDLVSNTTLGDYTTTAGLSQNYYTKTATDSAISSATQDLVSNTTLGDYTTTAGLSQNYYTKTATDSAISSATQDLVSNTTLANYTTTAGLTQNYYTKTATDSAISSATQNLVSNTTLANYTTTAGLTQNYYTKTATDSAISSATQNLVSNTTLANYTTTAGLTQNYYTKTDADSAIASATESLVATSTLDDYVTVAVLDTDYYTATEANAAISSANTALVATINNQLDDYTPTATLENLYYTEVEADSAIAAAVENLVSTTTLANYTTTAGLNQNYYTKTATDNAIAGAITTLSSGFDDPDGGAGVVSLQQAMTTQADINGTLKSSYAVKIDANGAVAGFGLASTTNALGVNESEFIINADRFALMRGGSNTAAAVTPFVVQANDTTINGTLVPAGVYMDAAFIKTAAIQSAQIGSVNADTITTGTLNVTELIEANAINASQLNLVGTGTLINLQSASNGSRMQILSDAIKVFDGNTLRVQLGNLSA